MLVPCAPPSPFSLCRAGGTQGAASSVHALSFPFCKAVGTQGEGVLVLCTYISFLFLCNAAGIQEDASPVCALVPFAFKA